MSWPNEIYNNTSTIDTLKLHITVRCLRYGGNSLPVTLVKDIKFHWKLLLSCVPSAAILQKPLLAAYAIVSTKCVARIGFFYLLSLPRRIRKAFVTKSPIRVMYEIFSANVPRNPSLIALKETHKIKRMFPATAAQESNTIKGDLTFFILL